MAPNHCGLRYLTPTIGCVSISLQMAIIFSYASITPRLTAQHHHLNFQPNQCYSICRIRCSGENSTSKSTSNRESEPENANVVLKAAWYASEFLGIATSFFNPPSKVEAPETALELARDGSGAVDRATVVKSIKDDFERSYFVTG